MIDYLKVNNDPRLSVIAEIPQPGLKNAANESLAGDPTAANQNGMPNGYDGNGGATDISKAPGYPGATGTGADANPTGGYSRPTSAVYLGLNTPGFILTYAETELLLAEAAERGWNVGPSASTHYANGANGDGWPDLYIARGGYSLWEPHTPALQDQLYLNDGKGDLALTDGLLPDVSASSKSCVRPCDYDGDGDVDLFVGCRVVPGQYPTAPQSFLLQNDGKGHFSIVSTPFDHIGMVSDAQWIDLDGDGRKDLVLCGEFMPVLVFMNTPGGFVDKTTDYFGTASPGFWNTLTVADVDGDGKEDLIAGNIGLNSCLKISDKQPAEFYYADFDHNGSIDPFLNFYIQGVSYPFVSRDELNQQIPPMRKKFNSYAAYADATMKDIFSPGELDAAGKLTATENRTVCWLRRGGHFVRTGLPIEARFAPVCKILVHDYDGDGHPDMLLLGNHSDNRLKLGSINANYGCLLKGDGKGGFSYVPQWRSGLSIRGDVKSAEEVTIDKKRLLVVGVSESSLQWLSYY